MNKLLETLRKVTWRSKRLTENHDTDRYKMTVTIDVTESQALAMQSMFEYMENLGNAGSSRKVAFYADGDGNFKPHPVITYDKPLAHELTDEMRKISVVEDMDGDRVYDFDPIGWKLRDIEEQEQESK